MDTTIWYTDMDMKSACVNQISSLPTEFLAATRVDQISYLSVKGSLAS